MAQTPETPSSISGLTSELQRILSVQRQDPASVPSTPSDFSEQAASSFGSAAAQTLTSFHGEAILASRLEARLSNSDGDVESRTSSRLAIPSLEAAASQRSPEYPDARVSGSVVIAQTHDQDAQPASLPVTETAPPLDPEELEKLGLTALGLVAGDTSDCPICISEPPNPVKTACMHTFCFTCIKHWFGTRGTCPTCHMRLLSDPHEDADEALDSERVIGVSYIPAHGSQPPLLNRIPIITVRALRRRLHGMSDGGPAFIVDRGSWLHGVSDGGPAFIVDRGSYPQQVESHMLN